MNRAQVAYGVEHLSNSRDLVWERFGQGRFLTWFMALGEQRKIPMVLGWATEQKIPYHEALTGMASELSTRQRKRVHRAAADLAEGAALSEVLNNRLSSMVPRYYVAAVKKAEDDHCLSEMLPQLARNVRLVDNLKTQSTSVAAYPAAQVFNSLSMVLFVYLIILPYFDEMARDMLEPASIPRLFTWSMTLSAMLVESGGLIVFLLCLLAPAGFIIWKLLPWRCHHRLFPLQPFFEGVFHRMPLVGGLLRRTALLETVGAMSVLTGAGYDVAPAARWNAATVSSLRLRRKLAAFAGSVDRGTHWADAWTAMRISPPAYEWVLRHAAARETPFQGFATLTKWLHHDVRCRAMIVTRWADVFRVLLSAGIVGISVIAVWQVLFQIMMLAMETT